MNRAHWFLIVGLLLGIVLTRSNVLGLKGR